MSRERLERVIQRRQASGGGFFDTVGARWDQLRIEAFGEVFHLEALTAAAADGLDRGGYRQRDGLSAAAAGGAVRPR